MLRGVIIGEIHSLLKRLDLDDDTLWNGLPDDIHSRQSVRLFVDLPLDGCDMIWRQADGDEDDLRVDTMLGLREKVCSDECWVGGVVCNNLSPPLDCFLSRPI